MAHNVRMVQVSLEIEEGSDPIAGTIRMPGEIAVPFVGWLALSAGLERLSRAEELREPVVSDRRIEQLTPAEREIVSLLCEGLTNPQIAHRLTVSARTVQGHLLRVFRKLGVSSRTELVARMLRAEMQTPPENEIDR